jgi:trehalose 6-phosphate phosphatase
LTEPLLDHLPEVARKIGGGSHFLLGLDFDGTLAPIVADPAEARIPDETRKVLDSLTSRPGTTVAVVSGRAVEDLRARMGPNIILAGNHGLEMLENGIHWSLPEAERLRPVLHEIGSQLALWVREIRGAMVEDKGLTASVHYRRVAPADLTGLAELVTAAVAPNLEHFFVRRGKKVFEILPRAPWNKGSAMLRILGRLPDTAGREVSVCYIGDDSTDEIAFRELTGAVTIRVGTGHSTAARFSVRDTRAVQEFLKWLSDEDQNLLAESVTP